MEAILCYVLTVINTKNLFYKLNVYNNRKNNACNYNILVKKVKRKKENSYC